MPVLVVNPFHRSRLKPRLHLREPLGSGRTGPNQPPVGADRDPPRTRVDSCPPPAKAERLLPPGRAESHPLPHQSGEPASSSRSGTPAASGGPSNLPPGRGGAGDGTWTDWYEMYMCETQGRISEPPGPPYPIGPAEARREAIGQIYDQVDRKEPPSHNIASKALRAYYTRVDPQILSTWACQILCMIAEYHMACMTRGSQVTSPIVPSGLEERLPPLADYAPPEDRSGATDVRIRDHRARTLRVAVLCHQLDMALSEEPASSGSLVGSRHQLRNLLAYFLSPGTAWELRFEDVVTQVLKENQRHIEKKRAKVATSLGKCNKRRTDLRVEFDATSEAMQMVTDATSGRELEHRLNSLQTSLTTIEQAITRYEDILEDCRMQEEEARQEEEIFPSRRRRRTPTLRWLRRKSAVMLSPLAPKGRLVLRTSLLQIPLVMLSPLRRTPSSCSRHPNP